MLGFWQGRPPYPTTASSSLLRPPLISSALSPCLNFTSFVTFHSTSILHTISLHLPISKSFSLNSYLFYVTLDYKELEIYNICDPNLKQKVLFWARNQAKRFLWFEVLGGCPHILSDKLAGSVAGLQRASR